MKIISKYKDYYDYLMGIRGVDPLVVLDRREGFAAKLNELTPEQGDKFIVMKLAICGRVYLGLRRWKKSFWGDDRLPYLEKKKNWGKGHTYYIKDNENYSIELDPQPTELNDKHNCPILLLTQSSRHYDFTYNRSVVEYEVEKFPKLKDYGIQRIYNPENIYNDLSNWISYRKDKPPIEDKRTDLEKVQNAGFDKTTSFRNM